MLKLRTRAALVASVTIVGVLAGCSASSSGPVTGGSVIRPGQVDALVARTSAVNNRANARLDDSLLRSYETASAYAIDSAVYEMAKLAHSGVPTGLSPFGVTVLSAAVPRRPAYPYDFAVIGSTYALPSRKPLPPPPCSGMRTLLVYGRTSPGSAWRISLEPSVDGASVGSFATQAGGYAPKVPAATAKAALAIPGRVARALEQYEVSGSLGPFQRQDFTGECWELPDPRADLKQAEAAGLSAREVFSPSGGVAVFMLSGQRALVIFDVTSTEQLLPPSPHRSIGWTSQPSESLPSALLPTGHYSQIDETSETEVAVVMSLGATHYSVVGDYSGVTSVTGTKSTAPVGPSGTSGVSGNSGQLVSDVGG